MKKPVYLVLFSLMLILTITVPAYAHGGVHHGGGHVVVSGGVFIGPAWGWGPGWGWGGPWWGWGPGWGYPYPYYPSQPVMQQPAVYEQTEQQNEEYYWYFCPDAKNYYPYVKQCPNGWLKVVPPQGPSQ